MKRYSIAAMCGAALGAAVMWISCAKPAPKLPIADIRGRVVGRLDAPDQMRAQKRLGFLKVEGVKEETTGYDRASITITDTTKITVVRGGTQQSATFADVHEGDSVEAIFTGPVLMSYPVQAQAAMVIVHPAR